MAPEISFKPGKFLLDEVDLVWRSKMDWTSIWDVMFTIHYKKLATILAFLWIARYEKYLLTRFFFISIYDTVVKYVIPCLAKMPNH